MDSIEHTIARRLAGLWSRATAPGEGVGAVEGAPARRLVIADATAFLPVTRESGADTHPLALLLAALRGETPAETPAVALLVEDPVDADALEALLGSAGRGDRLRSVREPPGLAGLAADSVAIVRTGVADTVRAGVPLLDPECDVLAWLSPAAPSELPLYALRALAARPRTDLLFRMPVADLRWLERYPTTPVADLPLHVRRLVEGVSVMMGDARFEWLAHWRDASRAGGRAAAGEVLADALQDRLDVAAGGVVRRWVVSSEPAGDDAALPLFLATPEPERVLGLNRLLFELRAEGRLPWTEPADPLVRLEDRGLLELFPSGGRSVPAGGGPARGAPDRVVALVALAHRLALRFAGQEPTLGEVMAEVAEGELFPEDVRGALRLLRRDRRAAFRSLGTTEARIRFFTDPDASAPEPPRSRPRAGGPTLWDGE